MRADTNNWPASRTERLARVSPSSSVMTFSRSNWSNSWWTPVPRHTTHNLKGVCGPEHEKLVRGGRETPVKLKNSQFLAIDLRFMIHPSGFSGVDICMGVRPVRARKPTSVNRAFIMSGL